MRDYVPHIVQNKHNSWQGSQRQGEAHEQHRSNAIRAYVFATGIRQTSGADEWRQLDANEVWDKTIRMKPSNATFNTPVMANKEIISLAVKGHYSPTGELRVLQRHASEQAASPLTMLSCHGTSDTVVEKYQAQTACSFRSSFARRTQQ